MAIAAEVKENYVPIMADDFEEGARVYHANGLKNSGLGTVKEIHDTWLQVLMDNGQWRKADIRLFDRKKDDWCWHKVLDLSKVDKGTEISRVGRRGRVYATVLAYIPNSTIVLGHGMDMSKRQLTAGSAPIMYQQKDNRPLEEYLLDWEIE